MFKMAAYLVCLLGVTYHYVTACFIRTYRHKGKKVRTLYAFAMDAPACAYQLEI